MQFLFDLWPTEVKFLALDFLLIFLLALGLEFCDGSISTLCAGHARHNTGILQAVFIQVPLQIRVEIAKLSAV